MKRTLFQVEVKIKASPSVQNISACETTVKKGSGEVDKTDSEETESVNLVNLVSVSHQEKEEVNGVVLVKASPAIVVDPCEKGEQCIISMLSRSWTRNRFLVGNNLSH